jgi:hypothetical protein
LILWYSVAKSRERWERRRAKGKTRVIAAEACELAHARGDGALKAVVGMG